MYADVVLEYYTIKISRSPFSRGWRKVHHCKTRCGVVGGSVGLIEQRLRERFQESNIPLIGMTIIARHEVDLSKPIPKVA